ncbi:MAG: hypothetical protein QOG85_843 [Gaiellaceae bacterium]|jgi:hypothetical protein|nr:hypothetical protein [Gaiellaceae bacterium]
MGHWNYRVVRLETGQLAIEEVGYDDQGKPANRCAPSLLDDNVDELRDTIAAVARALDEPILELEAFAPTAQT